MSTGDAVDVPETLEDLLPDYLGRQRWFAGEPPKQVEVTAHDEVVEGLQWLLVDAGGAMYQLVIGTRPASEPPGFLNGHPDAWIGEASGVIYYDAFVDPSLAAALLPIVAPGEEATHVRPMGVEQSNTSVVYDDRLVLKLFRRVREGANPDVEVTSALAARGFANVAEPVGVWRRDSTDLAVCQRYLAGAAEGWALALTSLRDLYASGCEDPGECGGDFAGDAHRLGDVTAHMHVALADAFGASAGDAATWATMAERQLERLDPGDVDAAAARAFVARMRATSDVGQQIRVHGDYHLGQVMQAEGLWYVLDFEGEPARPLDERVVPSSPLKDVAGMLRSFQYAAEVALSEQDEARRFDLSALAGRWEERNRDAFLEGYLSHEGIGELLPVGDTARETVLSAFELDKAVYEVLYERSHRPDWVTIPQGAIQRLLG